MFIYKLLPVFLILFELSLKSVLLSCMSTGNRHEYKA